jgi:chaperone required for assembly of F1-ATPase
VKRFWTKVDALSQADGWGIALDGRPVKTPARAPLILPNAPLAEAIAAEWQGVAGEVDPRVMPLTGLANAAIDRIAPDRQAFAAGLARYAEADLTCYRADAPEALIERQAQRWDPLLGWARRRYDVDFATVCGVTHVPQPQATVDRLSHEVSALDAFRLAGLSSLVTIGGSLVAALAVIEKAVAVDDAWAAVTLDEQWQLEQWGADAEAEKALEGRRSDFYAGARFLDLLDG